jgi:hypothetical protein
MSIQEVLLLAVADIDGGVCVAGMTAEPDPVTGLRWVRLVHQEGLSLIHGDTRDVSGGLQPFDVVEVELVIPCPEPPYAENWLTKSSGCSLKVLRHLAGQQRANFLREHRDTAPQQVLQYQERALCLLKPAWIHGSFRLDPGSGWFAAHLAFGTNRRSYRGSYARGGYPVFDPRWQSLGRSWLSQAGDWVDFDAGDLEARFGISDIYLTVGLHPKDRSHQISILTVHTVPELRIAAGSH